MYRPREFDAPDPAAACEHLRLFPFGVLVSHDGRHGLRATHLPFLPGRGPAGAFPATLLSHGSARNAHLQDLADGDDVLVVLPGPDAYVSGSWYRDEADVPTWNYTAVHVSGRYRRLAGAALDDLLDTTVRAFEEDRGAPGWSLGELPDDLVRGLARGVVAFAVDVVAVRAAAKLSQDKTPQDAARVVAGVRRRDGEHPLLAEVARHRVATASPDHPDESPHGGTA